MVRLITLNNAYTQVAVLEMPMPLPSPLEDTIGEGAPTKSLDLAMLLVISILLTVFLAYEMGKD